jgi:hypothetical protein
MGFWKYVAQIFSEDTGPSWFRFIATPIAMAAAFGFVWAIIIQFGEGVMYSSLILSTVLGFKTLQKKFEKKLPDTAEKEEKTE